MHVDTQPKLARQRDEEVVQALYTQLMEGWNVGNAEAFAAPFAEDGDLVAFDGTHFTGRQNIVDAHRPLFERWLKGTQLVGRVKRVHWLSPDIVVMHAVGGTIMRGKRKAEPARDSIQTLVAVRHEGGWQLVAFQNTRLRSMSRGFGAVLLWSITDWLWSQLFRRH